MQFILWQALALRYRVGLLFLLLTHLTFAKDFVIAKGQTIDIKVNSAEKIHITNRNVVRVVDKGSRVSVTGLKLGYTNVVTGRETHKILVSKVQVARTYERLNEVLKDFQGLRLETSADSAAVRGELLRLSDWIQIAETAKQENFEFDFEARLDADLMDDAHDHFRKIMARAELPPVRIVLDGDGRVVLPQQFKNRRSQYARLFKPFGLRIEMDTSTVALAPMVEVEIIAAEVERQFLRKIGVQWPEQHSFNINGTGQVLHENLNFALHALEKKGHGRVLASPKLLCRSGKEAEFLAGGEVPIVKKFRRELSTDWKRHGVILKVKPLADLSGRMSIEVDTEVSLLNFSERIGDLPSFKTNRIKTHFDLVGTRTIALSGLIKSLESKGRKGLPLLSELPILGALFSSKDYLEERTELVFFVTPRLIPYDTTSVDAKLPTWEP